MIAISIVSHNHGSFLPELLSSLYKCKLISEVILTFNIAEPILFEADDRLIIIRNTHPIGFGENHNNAFSLCTQPFFCVLNPDIKLINDPFDLLVECQLNNNVSLIAPLVISLDGTLEDSARYYPSVRGIIKKLLFSNDGRWPIDFKEQIIYPDWVAGMFMLFKSASFKDINGFDIRFFLYYEDVDLCRRLKKHNHQLGLCTSARVIHNARRTSHKNFRFMFWHLKSMLRFFIFKS